MEDLRLLIQSRFPILYVETYEEKRLAELLAAAAGDLGLPFWSWSVAHGLCRRGVEDAAYETTQPLAALRHIAALRTAGVYLLYDLHPYLADPAVVRQLRECAQGSDRQTTIVLCSPSLELPVELRRIAARYQLDLPGEDDIRRTVVETFRSLNQNRRFRYELDDAALTRFARGLLGLTLEEVRRMVAQAMFEDLALTTADIPRVLERKRQAMARNGALELIPIDADTAPLGGLAHLKQWLERTHAGFSAQARSYGLPMPKGVLLAGVQGCGKSLAAKTIARQWGVPLARLEPGRLFDKYVGESERHLREALENAAALAPVVLWIDEIEKVLPTIAGEADAGLGRRLFGSFLTWQQEHKAAVFVAATANDLGAVPPELLRKGRFDEIFFIDLPAAAERREILAIHLRLRKQDVAQFDLDELALLTDGFSGAELEQAVVAALYGMLADGATSLTPERLRQEIAATAPLAATQRERIAVLRNDARGRFVFAN